MLIRTLEELRLYNTSHALDDLEPLMGIIDNVEKDILVDKLGKPLYTALCSHYKNVDNAQFVKAVQEDSLDNDMDVLLRLSQAVVANEVINHAIALHLVSLNNSGLNMGSAEDYAVASKEAVETSRNELYQLTHIAINALLEWLEEKAQAISATPATPNPDPSPVDGEGSAANEGEPEASGESGTVHGSASEDAPDIAELWKQSSFYYQTTTLLIPSALVLREYWDTFDNREKFVRMLPDIRYAQDIIGDEIGEQWLDWLIETAFKGTDDAHLNYIIIRLRRACVALLESRTDVIRKDKERRSRAYDEGLKYLRRACEYMTTHQADLPEAALEKFKTSPLYVAPPVVEETRPQCKCDCGKGWKNNRKGNVMFVMPTIKK
jgi:hypothetical protein